MTYRKTVFAALVLLALIGIYRWDGSRAEKVALATEAEERLFTFEFDAIRKVSIRNSHGAFVISRADLDAPWMIEEPARTLADKDQVEPMLRNFQGAKRRNAFTPDPARIADFGLTDPRATVEIEAAPEKTGDAPRKAAFRFGRTATQSYQVYAQLEGDPRIFVISDFAFRQADRDLFALRDKTLIEAPEERVRSIAVSSSRGGYEIVRGSDRTWTLQPGGATADEDSVTALLRTLQNGKATRIDDKPTSSAETLAVTKDSAQLTLTVKLSPGAGETSPTTRVLYLGDTSMGDGGVYARREGETRIMVARAAFLADLSRDADSLRDRRLVALDTEAVRGLEVRDATRSVSLARADSSPQSWKFTDPGANPPSARKVSRLLADLRALRARSVQPGADLTTDSLMQFGLAPPSLTVRVTDDQGRISGFDVGKPDSAKGTIHVLRLPDRALLDAEFSAVGDVFKFREDLDDRRLFEFEPEKVEVVSISYRPRGQQEMRTRVATRANRLWRVKLDDGRGATIDDLEVASFLQDMQDVEFLDRYEAPGPGPDGTIPPDPLEKPVLRLTLKGPDGADLVNLTLGEGGSTRTIVQTATGRFRLDVTQSNKVLRGLQRVLSGMKVSQDETETGAAPGAGPSNAAGGARAPTASDGASAAPATGR